MLSELGRRPVLGGNEGSFGEDLEKEIALLLRVHRHPEDDDCEKEFNIHGNGSAPPSAEGSHTAVGGLFGNGGEVRLLGSFLTEEELRSNPAYLSYYYSNVNLNLRLPPPLLSKEDWRSAQGLQGGLSLGGVNMPDNGPGRLRISTPPGFISVKQESDSDPEKAQGSVECGAEG